MPRLEDKTKTPLFRLREELGLTQDALGAIAGIHPSTISTMENGTMKRAVSAERLVKLAAAVGKTPAEVVKILEGSGCTVADTAKVLIAA
jgi:transcriptional regulator with XRE-family HTH domain